MVGEFLVVFVWVVVAGKFAYYAVSFGADFCGDGSGFEFSAEKFYDFGEASEP